MARPPPTYFVLLHTPGPAWEPGKALQEQPRVMSHVEYLAGFFAEGQLVMGGPFLEDGGGMTILNVPDIEEARRIAEDDPTVRAGLLRVEVKPWLAAFHR